MASSEERQAKATEDFARSLKRIAQIMESMDRSIADFGKAIREASGTTKDILSEVSPIGKHPALRRSDLPIATRVQVVDKTDRNYGRSGIVISHGEKSSNAPEVKIRHDFEDIDDRWYDLAQLDKSKGGAL